MPQVVAGVGGGLEHERKYDIHQGVLSVKLVGYCNDTTRPFSSARARYHASTAPPSEVTSIHHKALRQPSNRNFHHHSKTEDFSCPVLPNIAQVCWTLWCSRLEVLLELHGYGRKLCVSEGLREHTCKLPGIWFSNFGQKLTPLIYSS